MLSSRFVRDAIGWILGVIASGILLYSSMPPVGCAPLAWFALVPALLATREKGVAVGFAAGVSLSLIAALFARNGLFLQSNLVDEDPGWIFGGYGLFALAIGTALAVNAASKKVAGAPWIAAAIAVLLEAALLLFMPAHLALSQSRASLLLLFSSITGIWGVSFLLWLCNFYIVNFIEQKNWHCVVACLVASFILSLLRIPPTTGQWMVGIIQTQSQDADELLNLNKLRNAQVFVWPELSAAYIGSQNLIEMARRKGTTRFVTTFPGDATPKPYNVAALYSSLGESARYRKRKLFAGESRIHTAGYTSVSVPIENHRAALAICFDSCFPNVIRDAVRQNGVDIVLLPTKDPPTPYGVIQALHAAYSPFRAAECGVPIVRADTTAYSSIVDAFGNEVFMSPPSDGIVRVASISPERRWTLYRFAGDWFLVVCGVAVIVRLILHRRPHPLS